MPGDLLPLAGRQAVDLARPAGDHDPLLGQRGSEGMAEVGRRVGHRHPLLRRAGALRDGAADDDRVPLAGAPHEEPRLLPRGHRGRLVEDPEVAEAGLDLHPRPVARLLAGPHLHEHAVVVEGEGVDRRRIPAGELIARPAGVDAGAGEEAVDEEQLARHPPDPVRRERLRPAAEDRVDVAVVLAAGDVRIAVADHREVAGELAAAHHPAGEEAGFEERAGAERRERRCGGQELGVRGEDPRLVGGHREDLGAGFEIADVDPELPRRPGGRPGLGGERRRERLRARRPDGRDRVRTPRGGAHPGEQEERDERERGEAAIHDGGS